jgi:hypothetical protein
LARSRETSPRTREPAGRTLLPTDDRRHHDPIRARRLLPLRYCIDVTTRRVPKHSSSRPHWLLALALPFSRSDRAHTTRGVGAGLPRANLRRSKPPELPSDLLRGRPTSNARCSGKAIVAAGKGTVNAGSDLAATG